jgi:hypothetical protein
MAAFVLVVTSTKILLLNNRMRTVVGCSYPHENNDLHGTLRHDTTTWVAMATAGRVLTKMD